MFSGSRLTSPSTWCTPLMCKKKGSLIARRFTNLKVLSMQLDRNSCFSLCESRNWSGNTHHSATCTACSCNLITGLLLHKKRLRATSWESIGLLNGFSLSKPVVICRFYLSTATYRVTHVVGCVCAWSWLYVLSSLGRIGLFRFSDWKSADTWRVNKNKENGWWYFSCTQACETQWFIRAISRAIPSRYLHAS